jgi:hypothetical protein
MFVRFDSPPKDEAPISEMGFCWRLLSKVRQRERAANTHMDERDGKAATVALLIAVRLFELMSLGGA